MGERVLVVGGNAAGMSAASRAKRLNPGLDITILEKGPFISYSICGLPYYLAGVVESHDQLISFTPETLQKKRGIRAITGICAEEIQPGRRRVLCTRMETGQECHFEYDKLIISTGYLPRQTNIEGRGLEGVFSVSRLDDGIRIKRWIESLKCGRAAVIGGGYIGLMMAHGLRTLGLEVTLFDRGSHLYNQVDEDMAELIEAELRKHGVEVVLQASIKRLRERHGAVCAVEWERRDYPADLVLIDVGIEPNTKLAQKSGLACGLSGAIQVDAHGHTGFSGVYAAGNCAETFHRVSEKPLFSGLGTSAAKQGRVVAENIAGERTTFAGTLETSIEKVFDLGIARTGLTLRQAIDSGFDADSVRITGTDHTAYYPDSRELEVKLIYERKGGRLLGGQLIGRDSAVKRIDTVVAALSARMTLADLAQLDLAYAPPAGTLWDPLQVAANVALRTQTRQLA